MASFKETRECYAENLFADGDVLSLSLIEFWRSKIPDNFLFDLYELDDAARLAEFWVRKRDIRVLANYRQISDVFHCQQRSLCEGIEGLCMLLRRLSYPCRYGDMAKT